MAKPVVRSRRETSPKAAPKGAGGVGGRGESKQGMLRFFDQKKGFGFIIRPDAPDLFVHASALGPIDPAELTDGRHLAYSVEQGRKGEQATNVRLDNRARDARRERPNPRPDRRSKAKPRR